VNGLNDNFIFLNALKQGIPFPKNYIKMNYTSIKDIDSLSKWVKLAIKIKNNQK
jgi:hypothetical protein